MSATPHQPADDDEPPASLVAQERGFVASIGAGAIEQWQLARGLYSVFVHTLYYTVRGRSEKGAFAKQVYEQSGLKPDDIDAAIIYDAFTSIVLWQLESFGFCKRGEAKDFIKNGTLDIGGRLPCNTHGGQLSEAYIHGMNGVNEGVRLIRGTSVNQPKKNDHVLVTGGVGVPTSGMILGKMP